MTKSPFNIAMTLLALAVLIGRMFITPRLTGIPSAEGTYETIAHLVVGFLIFVPFYESSERARMFGWMGWFIAIWEGGWFAVQKGWLHL